MKKTMLGVLALLLVGIIAVGAYALPFGNGLQADDAVHDALEAGDYGAYVSALEERWQAHIPTEEMFAEQAAHFQGMEEQRAAIAGALESGSYDVWLEAIKDVDMPTKFAEQVTADNFDLFVKFHQAMQSGDQETANSLAQELGFGMPQEPRFGEGRMGGRMGQGTGAGEGMGQGKVFHKNGEFPGQGMRDGSCLGQASE